ncbi:MAG TPA: hypothetical protein VH352_16450 [Pseudonocardiaceae bacterium]|jgi:hypothetical protein|nr:hypothetical protein [Pseudonocardiaceae bacterium]
MGDEMSNTTASAYNGIRTSDDDHTDDNARPADIPIPSSVRVGARINALLGIVTVTALSAGALIDFGLMMTTTSSTTAA